MSLDCARPVIWDLRNLFFLKIVWPFDEMYINLHQINIWIKSKNRIYATFNCTTH